MSTPKPARPSHPIVRRLVKVASLGIAGLIAGMLSGCSSTANTLSFMHHRNDASWQASLTYSPSAMPFRTNNHLDVRPNPALEQHYLNPTVHLHNRTPHLRLTEAYRPN
jgi:hypothetical protein